MKYFFVCFTLFFSKVVLSQHFADKNFYLVDSLDFSKYELSEKKLVDKYLKKYHATTDFSKRLDYLNIITEQSNEIQLWPKYNLFIVKEAEKYLALKTNKKHRKKVTKSYADALNDYGYYKNADGDKELAIYYYEASLPLYLKIKDKEGEALCYNNLGYTYDSKGDVLTALKYYFKSLKVAEKTKLEEIMSISYSNIGVIYDQQEDFLKSLEYYKKGLKIQLKIDDKVGVATSYNNIGFAYNNLKERSKAIYYFKLSNKRYSEIGDKEGIATSLGNIGNMYSQEKNYQKALQYFFKSLKYDQSSQNINGVAYSYSSIGLIYNALNQKELAKKYALNSLKISRKIGAPEIIQSASKLVSEIYRDEKQWEKAFEFQTLYFQMRDSINNKTNQKESIKLGLKYDFEKEKSLAKKENEKKLAISKEEKQKQRIIIYFTLGILLVVISFLVLIINRFKIIQKQKLIIEQQKHLVEEKNQEITDSITYAKRIQSAILPQPKLVKEYFKDSFILYKPKDIVAGDFYWFEVIDDLIFFAAADCTGHGVPGAMVSVVCHNALNRSVKEFNLKIPADILDKTREIVISEFEKSDEDVKDGMDISLCAINLKTNLLNWSGAHNPLWILRNKQIIEYKGDKQPIGKFAFEKPFTNYEIELIKNDEIFIATDGFQDQFGGEKGKKFMVSQIKKLLILHAQETIFEKEKILDRAFNNWMKNFDQVDDVCMIGFKI